MSKLFPLYFYLAINIVGFFFVYLYGRHTKKFLWKEYFAILVPPIVGLFGLVSFMGLTPLYVFAVSSLIGPIIEWSVGLMFHKILGAHLWIYERYPLPGRYTSWLTIPLWGFGLEIVWLVLRNF